MYNAARYAHRGTEVVVRLKGSPDQLELSVMNTGSALPDAAIHELFEPLRRGASAEADDRASLGLGLFIVREIA